MDIYLYTDEEGVAGVDWWDDRASVYKEDIDRRQRARELLMGEVNAAANGAFAAGADRVVAVQGHAQSFIFERADPRLEIITGSNYQEWLPAMSSKFNAAFCVGAHAMFGTKGATLAHTFSFEQKRQWWLNEKAIGEFGAFAAICAQHGVPVIMASGDDKFCAEATSLLPTIETACVKQGIWLNCACHLSHEKACSNIYDAAFRAVSRLMSDDEFDSYIPHGPAYTFKISASEPFRFAPRPGVELTMLSPTSCLLTGANLLDVIASATSY